MDLDGGRGTFEDVGLEIKTFLGPEMATSAASALILAEQFRNRQRSVRCISSRHQDRKFTAPLGSADQFFTQKWLLKGYTRFMFFLLRF